MGRHLIDRTGQKFNRLLVLRAYRRDGETWASCLCDCSQKKTLRLHLVVTGVTKSCGCLRKEIVGQRARSANPPHFLHGEGTRKPTAEYRAWCSYKPGNVRWATRVEQRNNWGTR